MSARWIPHRLTAELRDCSIDDYEEVFHCFQAEGDTFLENTVTGDESSCTITNLKQKG